MRIGIIPGVMGMLCTTLSVHAQESDSVRSVALPEVVIAETYQQLQNKKTALTLEVADRDFYGKYPRCAGYGYRFGILQADGSWHGL